MTAVSDAGEEIAAACVALARTAAAHRQATGMAATVTSQPRLITVQIRPAPEILAAGGQPAMPDGVTHYYGLTAGETDLLARRN